jgi:hypothetical protein
MCLCTSCAGPSKSSFAVLEGPGGRPVVSSKRLRLSANHPLSRSTTGGRAASTGSIVALTSKPSFPGHLSKSQMFQLRPSPPLMNLRSFSESQAEGAEHKSCISCKRIATSTLQLAKVRRCESCGNTSCPICIRACGGSGTDEAADGVSLCGRTVCRECSAE